jgi:hypothetical protein
VYSFGGFTEGLKVGVGCGQVAMVDFIVFAVVTIVPGNVIVWAGAVMVVRGPEIVVPGNVE